MHSTLTVRRAFSGDLAVVTALEEELFGGIAYPLYFFRQVLDAYGSSFLVAEDDSGIVGYVVAVRSEDVLTGWFWSLGVRHDRQRRGVGRILVSRVMDQMKSAGIKRMLLTVEPENVNAIALYKSLGFEKNRMESDYFGPGEDRLIMEGVWRRPEREVGADAK